MGKKKKDHKRLNGTAAKRIKLSLFNPYFSTIIIAITIARNDNNTDVVFLNLTLLALLFSINL